MPPKSLHPILTLSHKNMYPTSVLSEDSFLVIIFYHDGLLLVQISSVGFNDEVLEIALRGVYAMTDVDGV